MKRTLHVKSYGTSRRFFSTDLASATAICTK